MKELVIGTKNQDKRKELKNLLKGLKIKVVSLKRYPGFPDVKEGRVSFRQNAVRKAMAVSRYTKRLSLADDSGLEVAALGGAPGVCSSRFAGKDAAYADNNRKLLKLLRARKKRSAQFRCVAAICDYPNVVGVVEGKIRGRIADRPRGRYGFGYDPVFIVQGYNKTFAQLKPRIKNKISHRAWALKKAKKLILGYLKLDAHKAH